MNKATWGMIIALSALVVGCGGDDSDEAPCLDIVGTWSGTIEGNATTFYHGIPMVGEVTMTIGPGDADGELKLVSLTAEAWTPELPEMKVPLEVVGEHAFSCNDLDVAAPIEAQGVAGSGTVKGTCSAEQCTGRFTGKTDNETMDAEGDFTLTRQ